MFDNDDQATKNYRERLLGPDLIAAVPPEYLEIDFIKKFPNWYDMDLSERAMYKAHSHLENMKELIVEHMRLMKQIREEKQREVETLSANKSKTSKKR